MVCMMQYDKEISRKVSTAASPIHDEQTYVNVYVQVCIQCTPYMVYIAYSKSTV